MQVKSLRDYPSSFRLKKKSSNIENEIELKTTIENDIILPEIVESNHNYVNNLSSNTSQII